MASTASYQIVINGIKESVAAVDSLNKQLDLLEQRLDKLATKNVNISATGAGGGNKAALDEEARMLQQIDQLHQKVAASEKEQYQELLHAKEELKEYQAIAKSIAAQQNIDSGTNNLNTMQGMKAQLHDIKAAMQTMDVNSDKFKQFQKDANDLNNKLKEIEQGYGQFGRNVGNYANGVAEGMSKIQIKVGETTREFNNAREASRTLSMELKNMALNGQQGTKAYKDLDEAVKQMNSTLKDVSRSSVGMDRLLDTTQSIVAIANVGKGLATVFGVDDKEMQKSIQQLMALQSALQGLETLRKQMTTQEGIFFWITKGNKAVDSLVAKLTGAAKAQKALNTETTAGATASKGLAAAETAQATATAGATVATKALSIALKSIGIGLVIALVSALVTHWKDLYNWVTDLVPELKNISTWFDKIRAVAAGVGSAIINYMVQPFATLIKTIRAIINGNFDEVPKIIGDGLKKTFSVAENYQKGYHKETERQQKVHNNKIKEEQRKANEEQLKDEEAKYGTSHRRTQEYYRKQMALVDQSTKEGKEKFREYQRALWADERAEREEAQRKAGQNAKKAAAEAKKNAQERAAAEKQAQEKLTALNIALMRDGLKKELAELDAENKKELDAIRENGVERETLETKQMELYAKKRKQIINKYSDDIKKAMETSFKGVREAGIKNLEFTNDILEEVRSQYIKFVDSFGLKNEFSLLSDDELKKMDEAIARYKVISDMSMKNGADVAAPLADAAKEFGKLWDILDKYGVNVVEKMIGGDDENVLSTSLQTTIDNINAYYNNIGNAIIKNLEGIKETRLQLLEDENKQEKAEAAKWYQEQLQAIPDLEDPHYQEIIDHNKQVENAYKAKMMEIEQKYNNELFEINRNYILDVSAMYDRYYQNSISNFEDFQNELNRIASRQPMTNNWGIVNIGETKKQLREALAATVAAKAGIAAQFASLESDFKKGIITPSVYTATKKNLQAVENSIDASTGEIKQKIKDIPADFAQSLQQYVQAVGNAASTLMSSFGNLYDYNIQKQIDTLEDINEVLDDKLSEQEDIVKAHTDEINSIEDELAESRGDRRQHLIDQLNAEIQARREAAAEQKRIEAEMKRNQDEMDNLDKKRRMAQYKRDLAQILISGAMAVANGFATKPFMPTGLAMGALATSLTTAQYLIAKKQKPYAKGGQLDGGKITGRRHYAGGISVLGGTANVEGGEYITNRITTSKNIDLLDFVNSKKHKINLSELIDFYQSPKARKITSRTMFANGGQLPTIPDIDLGDIMNRPIVLEDKGIYQVAVTDIINKTNDVNRIKVIAGLPQK